jgi:hypothetical protein
MKEILKSGNIKGGAYMAIVTKRSGGAPVKRLPFQQRKDAMIPGLVAVQSL